MPGSRNERVRGEHAGGCTIGAAAAQVGMHPQTLREYERQGLIRPYRTSGGTRRYGQGEIDRLKRIQSLSEMGMSLVGIAFVLDMDETMQVMRQHLEHLERRLLQLDPTFVHSARVAVDEAAKARKKSDGARQVIQRSASVAIVHVPRARRSPRWKNDGY